MTKHTKIAASISIVTVVVLFFLANILSHSECGTAGIDYLPCGYWPRVIWSIRNGFWIPLVILGILIFVGSLLIQKFFKRH